MDTKSRQSTNAVTQAEAEEDPPASWFQGRVYRRLLAEGYRFQFSQVMRLLEHAFPDAPALGETTDYADPPIRLRPSTDMVFPPTDVKRVDRVEESPEQVQVVSAFMGLYGIDSPLPDPFHERLSTGARGTAPQRDFLDFFNHRFYAFFYRAWKKYRPELHYQRGGQDRHSKRFVSLAGLGTPKALDDVPVEPMDLAAQAATLGPRVRNANGLESLISTFLDDVEVEVIENVPRWVPIPSRPELGDDDFALGTNAAVGEKIYDRSSKFRIRLGPMDVDLYEALLPGGEAVEWMDTLVRLYAPDYLEYDLELQVYSDDMPPTKLGDEKSKLGLMTSLGTPQESITSQVVEYE